MLSLRRLSCLARLGSRIAAIGLAAVSAISARAANVPPEPSTPLPTLTLARGATSAPIALAGHFRDPDVPGSAVRITTRIGTTTRVMDLALFDAQAPQTVANFLAYVDAGRYAANFFHRSVPGFIIQTGGFYFIDDNTFDYVPTFPPVVNEPGASNTRGTIAMAKLGGDPDSATSQWFVNLADNSANLDAQNGGFTVFGRVLGDGMTVADDIAALTRYNASNYASAWTDLPLTAAYLARETFVETSAARVAPLSFTAASDNPTLVSASVGAGGALSLTAAAEFGGQTTIHITATDLEGATFTASFTVIVPRPQTITLPPTRALATGERYDPRATADSDLPVAYEIVSGPATIGSIVDGFGNILRRIIYITGPGEITFRVTQAGDAFHEAAAPVERTFTAAPPFAKATIRLPAATHVFNNRPYEAEAITVPEGLEVTYTYKLGSAPATAELPVHAGTYVVTATINDPRTLSRATAKSTLTIKKYPLQVRAFPVSRPVAQANPELEFEFLDFPNNEPQAIANPPRAVTKATIKSSAGNYPITFTGGSHPDFTFVTANPPAALTVVGFGGTYDALLGDVEAPIGKLTLTIPAAGLSYSGTITLASEAKPIVVKSASPLVFPDVYDAATGTWTRPAGTGVAPLTLTFSLSTEEGAYAGQKTGRIQGPGFDHAFDLVLRGRPAAVPLAGRHTLLLSPPLPPVAATPQGVGHATVNIAPKTAVLSLTGKLADGRPLTATIQPNIHGQTYLLWTNPYGTRLHSYFAGHLNNEHWSLLAWKKAGSDKDNAYRAGFGPLPIDAAISAWLPTTKGKPETLTTEAVPAITLAHRLGLAIDDETGASAFGLDYLPPEGAAITEAQIDGLPAALALTVADKLVLPNPNPSKFALTLNTATGAFSGSFVITDVVTGLIKSNPAATKPYPRKVTFSGVLRQPFPGETDAPVGRGFFLLDPLPGAASNEQVSGEIRLLGTTAE